MSDINTAKEFESHDICIHCNRVQQDKEIDKLQQQNQELREFITSLRNGIAKFEDENQDLKAFIKEACEVIRHYNYPDCDETGRSIVKSGCVANDFMNTDKYKEYSK